MATLYRKKPVEIEACQINTLDHDGMCDIIGWINDNGGSARAIGWDGYVIAIDTLEGTMNAGDSDWIIKGVRGEFYPCKPDIFAATYEPVSAR
jgi:hypothetical protein